MERERERAKRGLSFFFRILEGHFCIFFLQASQAQNFLLYSAAWHKAQCLFSLRFPLIAAWAFPSFFFFEFSQSAATIKLVLVLLAQCTAFFLFYFWIPVPFVCIPSLRHRSHSCLPCLLVYNTECQLRLPSVEPPFLRKYPRLCFFFCSHPSLLCPPLYNIYCAPYMPHPLPFFLSLSFRCHSQEVRHVFFLFLLAVVLLVVIFSSLAPLSLVPSLLSKS